MTCHYELKHWDISQNIANLRENIMFTVSDNGIKGTKMFSFEYKIKGNTIW